MYSTRKYCKCLLTIVLLLTVLSLISCGNGGNGSSTISDPGGGLSSSPLPASDQGGQASPVSNIPRKIYVYVNENEMPVAVSDSGKQAIYVSTIEEYENVLNNILAFSENPNEQIEVEIMDSNEISTTTIGSPLARPAERTIFSTIPGTDIGMRIGYERHFIGACINQYNVWHAHLAFKYYRGGKKDKEIVNIHLALWKNGANKCVGVYVTPREYCRKLCGNPKDISKKGGEIVTTTLSAYVTYSTARMIAQIAVPIIIAAAPVGL